MRDEGAGQGFVIENLKLKGFMRYLSPQKIDFKEKFTVITGRTGSGKTSLLDAITFALYGQTSRTDMQAVKLSDICAKGGYVSLSFAQKSDRYEVERGLDNKGLSYLTLWKNGSKVLGKITELTKTIEDIVGLDYTGFKNSTFVRQEEMKELGGVTPPVRLGIFQKLFRLETFEKAQEVIKKKLDDVKLEIREKESAVDVRRESLAKKPLLENELDAINKELGTEGQRLELVVKELADKEKQLDVLEKSHDEYTKIKAKIEGLEKELEIQYKRLSEKKSELEEFEDYKKTVEKLETEIKLREKLRVEWDALREKEHESSKLMREEELQKQRFEELEAEYEEKTSELNRELDREESRIAQLSTDIGEKEAFSILKREGVLTERIDRIEKELKWLSRKKDIVAQLKDERAKAREELWAVEDKSARINKDSFIFTEINENIRKIRSRIKKEEKNHKDKNESLMKELDEVNKKLKKIAFGEEDEIKLLELKDKIGELEEDKKKLDGARKRLNELGDVSSAINDLSTRRDEIEKNLKELAETESKSRSTEDEYRSVKETVRTMIDSKDEINKILYAKKGQVEQLKKRLSELEELMFAVKKDEQELDVLRGDREVYTILKDEVFHNRGIVMYAINQIMPQLSAEASDNLSDLSAGRFSRVKLEAKEEGARYGIGILVEGFDGAWHDVYEFSGGEKTQINAALRFSIAKELACLPQVGRTYGRMRTLFIDEGDLGSLDTETSRGLFVKKLFDMGEFFDKVILITHLSDVADTFPGKVRIEMTSENESRIHPENGEAGT